MYWVGLLTFLFLGADAYGAVTEELLPQASLPKGICAILLEDAKGKRYVGTGTLIGDTIYSVSHVFEGAKVVDVQVSGIGHLSVSIIERAKPTFFRNARNGEATALKLPARYQTDFRLPTRAELDAFEAEIRAGAPVNALLGIHDSNAISDLYLFGQVRNDAPKRAFVRAPIKSILTYPALLHGFQRIHGRPWESHFTSHDPFNHGEGGDSGGALAKKIGQDYVVIAFTTHGGVHRGIDLGSTIFERIDPNLDEILTHAKDGEPRPIIAARPPEFTALRPPEPTAIPHDLATRLAAARRETGEALPRMLAKVAQENHEELDSAELLELAKTLRGLELQNIAGAGNWESVHEEVNRLYYRAMERAEDPGTYVAGVAARFEAARRTSTEFFQRNLAAAWKLIEERRWFPDQSHFFAAVIEACPDTLLRDYDQARRFFNAMLSQPRGNTPEVYPALVVFSKAIENQIRVRTAHGDTVEELHFLEALRWMTQGNVQRAEAAGARPPPQSRLHPGCGFGSL